MSEFNDPPHDPDTGEIHEGPEPEGLRSLPSSDRAADGSIVQTTAHTVGHFLDFMEDGQFSQDVHDELTDLAATMTDISGATGNKVKGQIVITIDLEKDGDNFRVQGKSKVKKPEAPRPKSIVWQDDRNNFTRFPPNQRQMFGTRRPVRNV